MRLSPGCSQSFMRLIRFETKQLARTHQKSLSSPKPPSIANHLPEKKKPVKPKCWIRRRGEPSQFNFKTTELSCDKNDSWLKHLHNRSKVLSSTLRCKYSAPSETSKRRNSKEDDNSCEQVSDFVVIPTVLGQNGSSGSLHAKILIRQLIKKHRQSQSNMENIPPLGSSVQESVRPVVHCPDYRRSAFFRRMKQALRRMPSKDKPSTLQPIITQNHLGAKQFREMSIFEIEPWQIPEERHELLP